MSAYLTGAGHFGVGFLVGSLLFIILLIAMKRKLWVQLYAPFIPFSLGVLASIPYFLTYRLTCEQPVWANLFLLYSFFHCHPLTVSVLSNLHVVVVICGLLYVFIIWHYIRLVKHVRRYGWGSKRRRRA